MKVAIVSPTGNIGSKLAPRLLDAGTNLILLCRDAKKVSALTARGAKAEVGDLKDGEYVARATQGADALFWVTPPDFTTTDLYAYQASLARNAAGAIRKNGIKRVVNLSSFGAQVQSGTGPVAGLFRVEALLNEAGASVTHLRAAYFMENYLFSVETIRSAGSVFLPVRGNTRIPMVATQDIAEVAFRQLQDGSWTGLRVRGVHGPRDLSFDEAAGILSETLGRPVHHVSVSADQAREALLGMGTSPEMAGQYVEMYQAFDNGRLKGAEPRTPETTTPTPLSDFGRTTLKPILSSRV